MKLRVTSLILFACFAPGTVLAMQDDEAPRTTIQELLQLLNDNAMVVVDVRGQEYYLQGHIPGAISIPLDSVASRAEELKKTDKPIVTYCS